MSISLSALLLAQVAAATAGADTGGGEPLPEPDDRREIVVIAQPWRAAVGGSIEPEQSLDTQAIAGLGASNLADILNQLSAQTGGSQGRADVGQVMLLNGRRIGSLDEVRNLPPEAIERVDILPEEAALRLGYPANSKPVNVVLKQRYAAATGELEDRVTTRGLRNDFNTELNAVDIAGDNRMTLDMQYQIGDPITEAKRNVVRPLDTSAASEGGLVTSASGSVLAPANFTIAGVPATGRTAADFAAAPVLDDTGRFHTLVPATEQFTANGTFARALTGGKTITLTAKFDRLTARDLLGPAIEDVMVGSGPDNPFSGAVRLRRVLPGQPAVVRKTATNTYHFGAMLAGTGHWQWSASLAYDRADISRRRMGGVDGSALQAALASGSVAEPFATPAASLLSAKPGSTSSSHDQLLSADLYASGSLVAFRGGDIGLTLRASFNRETIGAVQEGLDSRLVRNHAGGLASIDVPLLPKRSAIGALDASINGGIDSYSDAGSTRALGASLSWRPDKQVSLLLAASRDQAVPTLPQLGAIVETTPDASLFDYGAARSIIASRIDGGDFGLTADRRTILKAELGWKPLPGLTATATYTSLDDRGALLAFPGLAPAAQLALPGRILRDATGAIVTVDLRPFNADREKRQELKLALAFSKNLSAGGGPRVPGGGSFGGGHSFGARGSMIQAALIDTIRIEDKVRLAPGSADLDLIAANPLSDSLRVPRHRIEAQFSGTHNGIGLRANAVWTSGGRAGVGSPGELAFGNRFFLNFRLFYFPASNARAAEHMPWLKGVRFLLAVDNLFDSYQHVADRNSLTPLAYQRGLLDPIGRTVRFSIRKTIN